MIKKWFMGLRGKFLILAFLPMLGFVFLTILALNSSNKLGVILNSTYKDLVPAIDSYNQLLTTRMAFGYNSYAAIINAEDLKAREHYIKETQKYFDLFKKIMKDISSKDISAEERTAFSEAFAGSDSYIVICGEVLSFLRQGSKDADAKAISYLAAGGKWHSASTVLKNGAIKVIELYSENAKKNNVLQSTVRKESETLIIALSASCALVLFVILMGIAHKVAGTISEVSSQLGDAGAQVHSAISQLSGSGQSLSAASTQAAASLEETVASLEQMSSIIQKNSEHAKEAATISIDSKQAAEQGERSIRNLMTSMHEISASSKKIEEIINVIDDIAFQTNLLALNAAVEAARAGEQGRGFAVVAEAVRSLAQRSAVAAKDISQLIKDSVSKIEAGGTLADDSGEALIKILNSVNKVATLNGEISNASHEQKTGITEINKAMTDLDTGVQANAASSEEIAATTEEISAQTQQMQNLVLRLNKIIEGTAVFDKTA